MTAFKQKRLSGFSISGDEHIATSALDTTDLLIKLLLLVGCFGFIWRFWGVGQDLLTPTEATAAMSAWRLLNPIADNTTPAANSGLLQNSLYILFSVFTPGEWQARLPAVLAGSVVVFFPLLFRKQLGDGASALACLLLAFSTMFTAAARSVDGSMLGWAMLFGLVWQLQAYQQQRQSTQLAWAAFFLGLGLGSAASFWHGILLFGLLLFLTPLLTGEPFLVLWDEQTTQAVRDRWQWLLLVGVVTFLASTSTFLLLPNGLSASGASLASWLAGWLQASGRPRELVFELLWLYEPGALLLGGFALGFGIWRKRPFTVALALWAVLALSLNLLYSGRQAIDGLWVLLPLILAAASLLGDVLNTTDEWSAVGAQVLVLGLILVVFSVFFIYFAQYYKNIGVFDWATWMKDNTLRAYLLVVVLCGLMVPITVALFALGWSPTSAMRSAVLASTLLLAFATLSASWRLNHAISDFDAIEIWHTSQTADAAQLLPSLIADASIKAVGNKTEIKIAAVGDPNGWLGWMLRSYPNVSWQEAPVTDPQQASLQILASGVAEPTLLTNAWIGTDLAVMQTQATDLKLAQRVQYWLYRTAPTQLTYDTLWIDPNVQLFRTKP